MGNNSTNINNTYHLNSINTHTQKTRLGSRLGRHKHMAGLNRLLTNEMTDFHPLMYEDHTKSCLNNGWDKGISKNSIFDKKSNLL